MKTHTIEKKYADWNLAFISMSNKQSEEAQILSGLIANLKAKMVGVA